MAIIGFENKINHPKDAQYIDVRPSVDTSVELPDVSWLTSASFQRLGPDLLIESPSGEKILLIGYFESSSPLNLVGMGGSLIPAHIVNILAGSRTQKQFAQAAGINSAEPIGQAETVEGSVFAVRVDGTRVKLEQGDDIFQGDTLETGEDGIIGVTFADESTLSLDVDGRMVIDEMVYDPGTNDGSATMFVLQGAMSFVSGSIAKANPEAMSINTPIATIGIRGTSVLISATPAQAGEIEPNQAGGPGAPDTPMQVTVVMLPEAGPNGETFVGEAIITTQGGVQVISGGFQATSINNPNQPPSPPQTVSLNEIGRVFGKAMSNNPNKDSIPDGLRNAVEKVVAQAKAEKDAEVAGEVAAEAEAKVGEAKAEAEAKASEAEAAALEAEALAEQAANAETAEEQAILEAQAAEATAAAEALAQEQQALDQQVIEAGVELQAAHQEVQQAEQNVVQAEAESKTAVTTYATEVGNTDLTSNTNLTGTNTGVPGNDPVGGEPKNGEPTGNEPPTGSEPDPEPQPLPEPDPEPIPVPDPDPLPDPEPIPIPDPDPEPEPERPPGSVIGPVTNDPPTLTSTFSGTPLVEDARSSVTFYENTILSSHLSADATAVTGLTVDPSKATVALSVNGSTGERSWTVTPVDDFNGELSVDITFTDGPNTVTDTLGWITVTAVNDAPTFDTPSSNAFVFDGVDDHVDMTGGGAYSNMAQGSVEAWVYFNALSGEQIILASQSTGTNTFVLSVGRVGSAANKVTIVGAESTGTINANEWTHIAYTFDGTEAKIYINGDLDSSHSGNYSIPATAGQTSTSVGAITDYPIINDPMNGQIDTISVWNTVLSDADIASHYSGGFSSTDANLRWHMEFDDGTATDLTGNGYDGTTMDGTTSAPLTTAPIFKTTEDTGLSGTLSASDVDGDSLTYSLSNAAGNGTAVINTDGTFTYTPNANYSGADSFIVQVSDGTLTDTQNINVNVVAINDAPVAVQADEVIGTSIASILNVVVQDDGSYGVFWVTNNTNGDLLGQLYSAAGNALGAQFTVNTAYNLSNPTYFSANSVIKTADGGYLATYQNVGNSYDVFSRKISVNGDNSVTLGSEDVVNAQTVNNQFSSVVTSLGDVNSDGVEDFAYAWADLSSGTTAGMRPYVKVINANGSVVTNEFNAASAINGLSEQGNPDITSFGDGTLGLAWTSNSTTLDVVYARFNYDGTTLTSPVTIFSDIAAMGGSVALANGTVLIAASKSLSDGDGIGVIATILNPDGTVVSPTFTINTTTTGDQTNPRMTALDDGGFVMVWQDVDGSGTGISGQRFDATGTKVGIEFRVNAVETGAQVAPNVDVLSDGRFMVTWLDDEGVQHPEARTFSTNGVDTPVSVDVVAGTEDIALTGSVSATDVDGDTLAYTTTNGTNGTVTIDTSGNYTYTPAANFNGTDSFVVTVTDNGTGALSDTVTINVDINDKPTINNTSTAVSEGATEIITAGKLDVSDLDGDTLTFMINTTSANGVLKLNGVAMNNGESFTSADLAANQVSYVHGSGTTPDSFNYTVSDGNGGILSSQTFSITVSGDELVNDHIAEDQKNSDVGALASGRWVTVWQSTDQDGSGGGIYGQMYNTDGSKYGSEFIVNTTTSDEQVEPSVIGLSNGDFVVAWGSQNQSGETGYGVYAKRYDAVGVVKTDEYHINTATTGDQLRPSMIDLGSGTYGIAYDSGAGTGQEVMFKTVDASDTVASAEPILNDYLTNDQRFVDIAQNAVTSTNIMAVWESVAQDGTYNQVYASYSSDNGATWGNEILISTFVKNGNEGRPSITALANGNYVVSWNSWNQDYGNGNGHDNGVLLKVINATGANVTTDTVVNDITFDHQAQSELAALDNGGFVTVFQGKTDDGSTYGIYGQLFNSSGAKTGSNFLINDTQAGNQLDPHVTVLADGDFVVTWSSYAQAGSATTYDVFSQRYNSDGSLDTSNHVMAFDGGDYISTAVTATLSAAFTLDVRITTVTTIDGLYKPIISKGDGTDNWGAEFNLQVQHNGNLNLFMGNGGGYGFQLDGGVLSDNTDYHIVATFDGTTGSLYLNGALMSTTTFSGTPVTSSNALEIGRYANGVDQRFEGEISDVRVWDSAIASTEFGKTITGDETGLISYLPLDTVDSVTGATPDLVAANSDAVLGAAGAGDGAEATLNAPDTTSDDTLFFHGDGANAYEGGSGTDTLKFSVGGTFDPTNVGFTHDINNIETLDFLNGNWNVTLDTTAVGAMSDGVQDFIIVGDASDALYSSETWTDTGTDQTLDLSGTGNKTYSKYDNGGYSIYVVDDVDTTNFVD